jgi:hypothetical protein
VTELVAHVRKRVLVAVVVAVLAPLLALLSLDVPGRPALALAFFLLVPGVAFAELLRLPSELASWCVAVSLSLAANILAAQIALVLDFWHPLAGQTVIALGSLVVVAFVVRRDRNPAGAS